MAKNDHNALILRPSSAIETVGRRPKGILQRMVSDVLVLTHSQNATLTQTRFRIGSYEFCGPDYRQILLWAKALAFEPIEVVRRLESSLLESASFPPSIKFVVCDGSISTLVWDFDLLPLTAFVWVDGLSIREVGFKGKLEAETSPSVAPRLPSLVRKRTHRQYSINF